MLNWKAILVAAMAATVLLALVVLPSRRELVRAHVSCPERQQSPTSLGHFNISQLQLGDVLAVDDYRTQYVMSVPIDAEQIRVGDRRDLSEVINFDFELEVYGSTIQPAIEAEIRSVVAANATLSASNVVRHSIAQPARIFDDHPIHREQLIRLARRQADFGRLDSLRQSDRKLHLIVVTTAFTATDLKLGLDLSGSSGLDSRLVQVGKFDVHVEFACGLFIGATGDSPVFLRFSEYVIDGDKLRLLPTVTVDVTDIDWFVAEQVNSDRADQPEA